jgi:hypothetical protein
MVMSTFEQLVAYIVAPRTRNIPVSTVMANAHFSPGQVPSMLRHTFPSTYRFGWSLPPECWTKVTLGGTCSDRLVEPFHSQRY